MNTAFIYRNTSCIQENLAPIVSDLEAPINRSFLRPNFHLKWCWHCPPMVVDSTTPPGFLRMVFPTSGTKKTQWYINTMLSHDFKSKFQTIRVIYLPYHPFYANQSSNEKINALKPPTPPQQLVQSSKKCSFSNCCNPENIATVPVVPNKGKDHQGPRSRERGVSKTSLIHPLQIQKEGKTERKEGIITQKHRNKGRKENQERREKKEEQERKRKKGRKLQERKQRKNEQKTRKQ